MLLAAIFITSVSVALQPGPQNTAFASQSKVLYLTFDDGPSGLYTPQILDVLRREHVHATFFVLGYRCRDLPAIVRRMQREGHEVGSHGFDHRYLPGQPRRVVLSEVTMADTAISQVTGHKPRYYRPTYGALDRSEIPMVNRLGHRVMYWSVDSLDWKATSADFVVRNVEGRARPGSIVLFHDGVSDSRYTVKALPTIIRYYKAHGYVFRTL
ncbi:polysaccharide deacetylase family protein [Alicyclobacillus sp. ALC3]|nr:polysaccharide deacetylase family protein [Alicyclobacillus sp. ALC3]